MSRRAGRDELEPAVVLVVDDEPDLVATLEYALQRAGYGTRSALTGGDALALAMQEPVPDAVLLDLMLPDLPGTEVLGRLRAAERTRDVPVLILTAKGDEADRLRGFEVGADDYLVKPFSVQELLLRIRAILRRRPRAVSEEVRAMVAAAVDLGSNSFHLVVARAIDGELHVLDRVKERVRLAAGLDSEGVLSADSQARALECLERFAERIRSLEPECVRAVGTNTLRKARNRGVFLERAGAVLGVAIDVISGREEARLVYLGVSHTVAERGVKLVVDIGGGSTECIIGEGFEPKIADSLYMGCVSFSSRFFGDGALTAERFGRAETAAGLELQTIERRYRQLGWEEAFGSSGTILAADAIVRANGWSAGITREGLESLRGALIAAGHIGSVSLAGLAADRAPVLPGGLAILIAVMDRLGVEKMEVSEGALREGVLFDLLGRRRREGVRERTIQAMVQRYAVDVEQAERVERTALMLLDQVAEAWSIDAAEARNLLSWAAKLHEIGLSLSFGGYHKHGAYLVANTDMPGFSRQESELLALLIQGHRRKLTRVGFGRVGRDRRKLARRLCLVLRLAVCLNRSRSEAPLPEIHLTVKKNRVELRLPAPWLESQPLTAADLETEVRYLRAIRFELTVVGG